MVQVYVKRTYKDTLFRMIFREKKELLTLYNALNGSDFSDPDELEIRTIEDVLYMGMKNDSAFLIDDYLNLYEAQSSPNPNMPLRGLFYFSRLYQGYVSEKQMDIFSQTLLELPTPKYVVFYNGTKKEADVQTLRLSDAFRKKDGQEVTLECVVTMLNVNYGHNEEIMQNCRKLYEYSYLVQEIRQQLKAGLALEVAVDKAVEICILEGILEDFLRKHRAEVKDVILSEYDEKLHIDNEKSQSFKEGKAAGLHSGLIAGRAESLLDILEEKGEITTELRNRILVTTDPELLRQWVKGALKAESVEAFMEQSGLL